MLPISILHLTQSFVFRSPKLVHFFLVLIPEPRYYLLFLFFSLISFLNIPATMVCISSHIYYCILSCGSQCIVISFIISLINIRTSTFIELFPFYHLLVFPGSLIFNSLITHLKVPYLPYFYSSPQI